MSATRARSAPRTIVAIAAALGLLIALALPAVANHDPADGPEVSAILVGPNDPTWNTNSGGNLPCPTGTVELKFEGTTNGTHSDSTTVGTSTVNVEFTVSGNVVTEFEVENGLAAIVFVKAENAGNVYDYRGLAGGGIAHDDGLVSPATDSVSHVSFCLIEEPEETPTPTPTEEETASPTEEETPSPTPTPTESQAGEEETPTPTPRDDTKGGTPTPTPGTIPDTSMGGMDQVPATVLSLIMLAALAGTAYARLARQR